MRRLGTLIIACAALAAAASCYGKERRSMNKSSESVTDLGRELHVTFPPSTRVIGVERENGMDDLVRAKVQIAEGDWSQFLGTTPIKSDSFRPGPRGFLGQDHGFWDPHQAAGLRSAQAILPGQRALNVGVTTPSDGKLTLYIVNHGT